MKPRVDHTLWFALHLAIAAAVPYWYAMLWCVWIAVLDLKELPGYIACLTCN